MSRLGRGVHRHDRCGELRPRAAWQVHAACGGRRQEVLVTCDDGPLLVGATVIFAANENV